MFVERFPCQLTVATVLPAIADILNVEREIERAVC